MNWIFLIYLLVCGTIFYSLRLFLVIFLKLRAAKIVRTYLKTKGTVIEIVTRGISFTRNTYKNNSNLPETKYYEAARFSYTVQETEYEGEFPVSGYRKSPAGKAEISGKYNKGTKFPVYYNPERPEEYTINTNYSVSEREWMAAAGLLTLGVIGAAALLLIH